jgi:phosphatidylglycerophosphatase C
VSDGLVVAAFDFDGTLTRGGSVWRFLSTMVGARGVLQAGIVLAPRLVLAAIVGGEAADDAKEALFIRTLGGLDAADVAVRAAEFGRAHYRSAARADVRDRMEWHRHQGHRLVIVSASPRFYVSAVGDDLGVDAVLATMLEIGPTGLLTGHYEGRNCRGREKLDRVRAQMDSWAKEEPEPLGSFRAPELWAYGNSAGDRALLRGADVGVDVGRLGRFGRLRGLPRLAAVT